MTTTVPITPLTKAEQRVAEHLVRGLTAREIAPATGLACSTVQSHLSTLRTKVHCPRRCTFAVVAHRLLSAGAVTTPAVDKPVPHLTPAQFKLLGAVAEYSTPLDIARAADIAPADYHAALAELLEKADQANTTRLVAHAHAWRLLGAEQSGTEPRGAKQ